MSEETQVDKVNETGEIALFGFPAPMRDQLGALLDAGAASYAHVTGDSLTLSSHKIALYFWPDRTDIAKMQLQLLRRANMSPRLPIIIVSGQSTLKDATESVGMDADGLLKWPFSLQEFAAAVGPFCKQCVATKETASSARLLSEIANSYVNVINRTLGVECRRGEVKLLDSLYRFRSAVVLAKLSRSLSGLVGITMPTELADEISLKLAGKKWVGDTSTPDETGLQSFSDLVHNELNAASAERSHRVRCEKGRVFRAGPQFGLDTRGEQIFAVEFFANEMPFEVLVCLQQKQGA